MKAFKLILIISIFTSIAAFAQSSDELQIRQLEKHWTQLLDQGDTTALLKIWTKDYVVNNPNGKIVTPKEIVALMKNGHKFPSIERIIEKITFNQNIAIVMGKELQQPANMIANKDEWIPASLVLMGREDSGSRSARRFDSRTRAGHFITQS
jgi:hypothetical protein